MNSSLSAEKEAAKIIVELINKERVLERFGNNIQAPSRSVNVSLYSMNKDSQKRMFKLKITPAQLNQLVKAKKSYIA